MHTPRIAFFSMLLMALSIVSCQQGQSQSRLSAKQFYDKMNNTQDKQVVDVRTPGEFAGGYIHDAVNIDWNGNDFDNEVSKLDKSKPTFVYCLSGGRSDAAAAHMQQMGFKHVYAMIGGLIKWNAAGLPLDNGTTAKAKGMSMDEYNAMIKKDKPVLVDFYAPWCEPCKKMAPYIEEIGKGGTIAVVRVNADDNPDLMKQLGIDALPTLNYYKGGQLVWNNVGYIPKEELLSHLK